MEQIDAYPAVISQDDDGDIVATTEVFPELRGFGDDPQEAMEDLEDEITDYLRRVVAH